MSKFRMLVESSRGLQERQQLDSEYETMIDELADVIEADGNVNPTQAGEYSSAIFGACVMLAADSALEDAAFVGNHTPMQHAKMVARDPLGQLNPQQISGLKKATTVILSNLQGMSSRDKNQFDRALRTQVKTIKNSL